MQALQLLLLCGLVTVLSLSFSVAFILVCVTSPEKQKVFCFSWQNDLLHQKGYKLWVCSLVAVGTMAISLAFPRHQ